MLAVVSSKLHQSKCRLGDAMKEHYRRERVVTRSLAVQEGEHAKDTWRSTIATVHADVGYGPAMVMLSAYGYFDGKTRDDPGGRSAAITGAKTSLMHALRVLTFCAARVAPMCIGVGCADAVLCRRASCNNCATRFNFSLRRASAAHPFGSMGYTQTLTLRGLQTCLQGDMKPLQVM